MEVVMATYIILSKLSPDAVKDPKDFKGLAATVAQKIRTECPGVTWKDSYATFGRFDVVDVVDANDEEQIARAALIIRAYGHSTTETLSATPWQQFLDKL
jgi:uncharacterized protein with GYD domain